MTRVTKTIFIISIVLSLALAISCKEGVSMKLDAHKYFSDNKTCNFVDDIQLGNVARVKQALDLGMDPNSVGKNGFRPIHFAFFPSDTAALKLLLAAGADPNARIISGNTPLQYAVRLTNPDFTRVLLQYGADPNSRGENDKPVIHEALTSHQPEILKLVTKAGGNPDAIWGGTTPVLAAMKMFLWEMATTLIDLDSDLTFRDNTGKNAIERFCFQIKKVPPTPQNRKDIPLLAAAFIRHGVVIPCVLELRKFQ